jgi:phenylacetate-CoA ligase
MFVPQILTHWQPLTSDDVLVNATTPGGAWSAHYFYNAAALVAGAAVIPFRGMASAEGLNPRLDYFESQGATALAATPAAVMQMFGHCATIRRLLPSLRKLLWVGDEFDALTARMIQQQLPDIEVWGLYGSPETWIIGWNGPHCRSDTVHPLPYQRVEIEEGAILVSNTHDRCINPLLRYEVGGRGSFTRCSCDRDDQALQILGRTDSYFKFAGQLVSAEEIAALASELDDVIDAQILLTAHGKEQERMEIRVSPSAAPRPMLRERVRHHILASHFELANMTLDSPESIYVTIVPRLTGHIRATKTPVLIPAPRCDNNRLL